VWFDRGGKDLGVVGRPEVYGSIALAPNEKAVLVDRTDMGNQTTDLWTYDLQRQSAKRLTFGSFPSVLAVWSPDASRIAFTSQRTVGGDVYMKNSDGTQEEKRVVHGDYTHFVNGWSRDGKYILYSTDTDLRYVTLPQLEDSVLLKVPSVLRNGQFSPDGKWVAYASNESGKWEIYVTSFPDAHSKWQVSIGGGEQPRWRGDGKELFYLSGDRKMTAVPVTTGNRLDPGTPVVLFQANPRQAVSLNDQFVYDVSRDGQKFLILTPVKQVGSPPMSVILNWLAALKKE